MGERKTTKTGFDFPIIDMHAHFLPGMDDGSRTMEETVALLRAAAEQGIGGAVATPHYSGRRSHLPVKERLQEVQEVLQKELLGFPVYEGCENFYHESLPEQLRTGQAKTLAGSSYVLVEFDPSVSFEHLFRGIRRISDAGFRPVLAHMERYACIRNEKYLLELMRIGCVFQMNFDSLKGGMFSMEVRWCRKQVLKGRISFLGTDMHRTDFRPPDITEALNWLKKHVEPEELRRILYENPMKVLKVRNAQSESGSRAQNTSMKR